VNGFCVETCHDQGPFVLVIVTALFMVPVFVYLEEFPNLFTVEV